MDPNRTIERWRTACAVLDEEQAQELEDALVEWLTMGGFGPSNWTAEERGFFERRAAA